MLRTKERGGPAGAEGQVFRPDQLPAAENDRPLHHIFQLPHVARPLVGQHSPDGIPGKLLAGIIFLIELGQKMVQKGWDIGLPLPEGRDADGYHVEPVEQILAEGLLPYHLLQVPVGSGHHPLNGLLLEYPQQPYLHVQG